jgi:hypothetical protein
MAQDYAALAASLGGAAVESEQQDYASLAASFGGKPVASVDPIEPATSHSIPSEIRSLDDLRRHPGFQQMKASSDERMQNMPAAAAMTAAFLSGGASLPLQAIAAGGGGYLGARGMGQSREDAAMTGGVQGALQAVGAGAPRLLTGLGRRMYQGALKPTKAILSRMPNASRLTDTEKAAQLADVGLREGINVSRRGLTKAGETIGGLNDEIASALQSSTATVPRQRVIRRLVDPVQRFRDQVTPLDDLRHIAQTGREFRAVTRPDIPVQQAQRMKQGTYRALAGKFGGEVKSASAEAQKALARGLKEEIADAVPGVGALNARESQLLTLKSALEDAVRRTGNRDLVGLTDVVAAGTNPGLLAATLAMRAPVQSGLARVAHRTGETLSPDALVTALRALLAARPSADERGGVP